MQAKKLTPNLMVEKVNTSLEFYKMHLDAEVILTVPTLGEFDFAILQIGETELMLQSRNSLSEEIPDFQDRTTGGSFTLYFEVEDIEACYKNLRGRVEMVQDIHETFYGTREFSFKDPNSYIIALSGKVESKDDEDADDDEI